MPKNVLELSDDVKDVLRRAGVSGNTLDLAPVGQLERKRYEAVNKALELLGGKWNRGKRVHVFADPVSDVLAAALSEGEILDTKKAFQVFETPKGLAAKMCGRDWADLKSGQKVLEPSAGRGRLLSAIQPFMIQKVAAVEVQPGLAADLQKAYPDVSVVCADFLTVLPTKEVLCDRIAMNPPFTAGQDIAHIRHAYDFLLPGGVMVALSAPGWRTNGQKNFRAFREWLLGLGIGAVRMEVVPSGTFAESGTVIATVLLRIEKPL